MKSLFILLFLSCISFIVNAEKSFALPVQDIVFSKSSSEDLIMTSRDGRYRLFGKIYDSWNDIYLDNYSNVIESFLKIDTSRLPFDLKKVTPFIVGTGIKPVYLFIDPTCPACKRLLEQITDIESFTYYIIPIPVRSSKSFSYLNALACTADISDATKRILASRYEGISVFPPEDCPENMRQLPKYWQAISTVLSINEVPFIIRHDGYIFKGIPSNFLSWLRS